MLLSASEKEIQKLVKKNDIPYQEIQDKIFFNKQQIIEWALGRSIPLNLSKHKFMNEYHIKTLNDLLDTDSFFYDCDFNEELYVNQMVERTRLEKNVDKSVIIQLLKSREELMSTAIGNGVSLPHPRIPLMVGKNKPLLNFFFLKKPLDLNSLDGKPVHTIILLISQTIRQHLSLIAHTGFLLSNESFRSALENRLDYPKIIDIIKHIENTRSV